MFSSLSPCILFPRVLYIRIMPKGWQEQKHSATMKIVLEMRPTISIDLMSGVLVVSEEGGEKVMPRLMERRTIHKMINERVRMSRIRVNM